MPLPPRLLPRRRQHTLPPAVVAATASSSRAGGTYPASDPLARTGRRHQHGGHRGPGGSRPEPLATVTSGRTSGSSSAPLRRRSGAGRRSGSRAAAIARVGTAALIFAVYGRL